MWFLLFTFLIIGYKTIYGGLFGLINVEFFTLLHLHSVYSTSLYRRIIFRAYFLKTFTVFPIVFKCSTQFPVRRVMKYKYGDYAGFLYIGNKIINSTFTRRINTYKIFDREWTHFIVHFFSFLLSLLVRTSLKKIKVAIIQAVDIIMTWSLTFSVISKVISKSSLSFQFESLILQLDGFRKSEKFDVQMFLPLEIISSHGLVTIKLEICLRPQNFAEVWFEKNLPDKSYLTSN